MIVTLQRKTISKYPKIPVFQGKPYIPAKPLFSKHQQCGIFTLAHPVIYSLHDAMFHFSRLELTFCAGFRRSIRVSFGVWSLEQGSSSWLFPAEQRTCFMFKIHVQTLFVTICLPSCAYLSIHPYLHPSICLPIQLFISMVVLGIFFTEIAKF